MRRLLLRVLVVLAVVAPVAAMAHGQNAEAEVRDPPPSLAGRLLVASPAMASTPFAGTVILVCSHDASGAFGFVVNRRAGAVEATADRKGLAGVPVDMGGPVGPQLLFLLTRAEDAPKGAMLVANRFAIGNPEPYFADADTFPSPAPAMLVVGYSGWGGGQLEEEIERGDWLVVDADDDLVFTLSDDAKWARAIKRRGQDL